jgi:hypothetical protein
MWVGSHVLAPTESAATTYTFSASNDSPTSTIVLAFRGARVDQPITPTIVQVTSADVHDGGATIDVPSVITRGVSSPLFVVALDVDTTFPILDGFDRTESTANIAVYRPLASAPDGIRVAGPHLEFLTPSPGAFGKTATASLGVVAPATP